MKCVLIYRYERIHDDDQVTLLMSVYEEVHLYLYAYNVTSLQFYKPTLINIAAM